MVLASRAPGINQGEEAATGCVTSANDYDDDVGVLIGFFSALYYPLVSLGLSAPPLISRLTVKLQLLLLLPHVLDIARSFVSLSGNTKNIGRFRSLNQQHTAWEIYRYLINRSSLLLVFLLLLILLVKRARNFVPFPPLRFSIMNLCLLADAIQCRATLSTKERWLFSLNRWEAPNLKTHAMWEIPNYFFIWDDNIKVDTFNIVMWTKPI